MAAQVYGIGNILMDILVEVKDKDLNSLGLTKGSMRLIDDAQRQELLSTIQNKDKTLICGGSAANTIITLAALGIDTALSGRVGRDAYGGHYQKKLAELGVRTDIGSGQGATGSCLVMITPDSERTLNTHLGINRAYGEADLKISEIQAAPYLYFCGYMWDTDSQKAALKQAIAAVRGQGGKIVFDLADIFAARRSKEDFLKLTEESVDIVFANEQEAAELAGQSSAEANLDFLASRCQIALVKRAEKGALLQSGQKRFSVVADQIKAKDSTGAGDAFAAGFLYGLCRQMTLPDCLIFAAWLAGQCVEFIGAQFSSEKLQKIIEQTRAGEWRFSQALESRARD